MCSLILQIILQEFSWESNLRACNSIAEGQQTTAFSRIILKHIL